ncbi:MAG: HD domain-containing protein [Phycicoccus sp.]|nr:HD domain-containing protein [Phycicoccus sp.]NMM33796.1 HD domain-containing protein [Phycicoccus sp.]
MTTRARRSKVEVAIGVLGTVLTSVALVAAGVRFGDKSMFATLPTVGVFFVAIVIGEIFRLTLPGSRRTAPLATAAALAFAMTVDSAQGVSADFRGPLVIAVTAVAMAVGTIPNLIRRKRVHVPDLANRLIGITVAALLFREVPVWEGRTILELHAPWPAYVLALVMLLTSAIALIVELFLMAWLRAARSHAPLLRTIEDEFRAALALSAALGSTGALVALAERPLGLVAIPLFLFPLFLTQFAVRRQSAIRRTYRQTIRTLSRLTELGGYTEVGHASRVAALSMAMGHELGMSERDMVDLEYAALLHDIGQVSLTEPIPGGATVLAAPADQRRIAHDGAEIVRQTGVLENVAVILEAQTTPFRQVREFGEVLPLSSRVIKVCNAYDDLAGGSRNSAKRDAAVERIHLGLGYEYDPRVVEALVRALARSE